MRIVVAAILAISSFASFGQKLALTFDDGLDPSNEPHAQEWNGQLLAGLSSADVSSMIFPALSKIGGEEGKRLVMSWSASGHLVGNHTSRHRNLASPEVSLAGFIADVEEADAALNKMPTWVPMLRFPYLKEGDTLAKRDGIRNWMLTHGYRSASISIDTSDWYFNEVWLSLIARGRFDELARLQTEYINHLLSRAGYYDELARKTLGSSPMHVALLHVNAINAASVEMLIAEFRKKGWEFVTPARAFADPIYSAPPDTLPAGESIIWAKAKAAGVSGLRYPAEDSEYEEPALGAMHFVP